jgi:hypothetical protein
MVTGQTPKKFMNTICPPKEEKYGRLAKEQNAWRKDVEGACGVLQFS